MERSFFYGITWILASSDSIFIVCFFSHAEISRSFFSVLQSQNCHSRREQTGIGKRKTLKKGFVLLFLTCSSPLLSFLPSMHWWLTTALFLRCASVVLTKNIYIAFEANMRFSRKITWNYKEYNSFVMLSALPDSIW